MVMTMVLVTMMMRTDDDDDDHMLDNATAWAPHLSWWVGSIEEKEAQSVLRITPRLMNLFKGPSETSMYFKLHPPCLPAMLSLCNNNSEKLLLEMKMGWWRKNFVGHDDSLRNIEDRRGGGCFIQQTLRFQINFKIRRFRIL